MSIVSAVLNCGLIRFWWHKCALFETKNKRHNSHFLLLLLAELGAFVLLAELGALVLLAKLGALVLFGAFDDLGAKQKRSKQRRG